MLFVFLGCALFNNLHADPPPPPGGGGIGGGSNQSGGGAAPIDGGLTVLLAFAGAYGTKKVLSARKKTDDRC